MKTVAMRPLRGAGPSPLPGMNLYCSSCRETRRFIDRGAHLECDLCRKVLVKLRGAERSCPSRLPAA